MTWQNSSYALSMVEPSVCRAFSPGHITGFFEICNTPSLSCEKGSRGAGINLSLGAFSTVHITESSTQQIDILLNGKQSSAPVTRRAVHYLIGKHPFHVVAQVETQLPHGQGFGMSAAGSLATTLALGHLLHLPRKRAVEAAHCAEIDLKTGLGDVVAMSVGGIEIRVTPGIGGKIKAISGDGDLVLVVLGPQLWTRDILSNHSLQAQICRWGKKCTTELLADPVLPRFFQLSYRFVKQTGLASPVILEALKIAQVYGRASMCCLGNSIFCMGDTSQLLCVLKRYGPVFVCTIDTNGARLVP